MRLTCPSCGAQYEIPESVIPATGREVECSACAQVWHQPGPDAPAAPADTTPYDVAARPALNRPLHESVLAILREETARELAARRSENGAGHVPGPVPESALPPADQIEWPVATVILPGAPLAPDTEAPAETAPETSVAKVAPAQAKDAPEATRPFTRELPDAERLAATLLRKASAGAAAMATDAPAPVETLTEPAPVPTQVAPKPAQPVKTRSGYGMGFALAVMLAGGLLAFYLLAPKLSQEPGLESMAAWRQNLDQGRAWLQEQSHALAVQLGLRE